MLSLNILFPVLNEERRLKSGIETTLRFIEEHMECPFTITIIDNGSTDKTAEIGNDLCAKHPEVRYIRLDVQGVGAAFRAGIDNNTADIVGYMDVDLSTDIRHLSDMYQIFLDHPEIQIVNGSRHNKKSNTLGRKWYRNITSHGLVFILKIFLGMKATDAICGFKFFRKHTAEKLTAETCPDNGWFFVIELLLRAERHQIPILELPVRWMDDYNTTVHVKKLTAYYLKNIFLLKRRFNKINYEKK